MKIIKIYFNILLKNYKYLIFYFKRKFFKNYFYDSDQAPHLRVDLKEVVDKIFNEIQSFYFSVPNYDQLIERSLKIKEIVNKNISFDKINQNFEKILNNLNNDGFSKTNKQILDKKDAEKIKKNLENFTVYSSHIPISASTNKMNLTDAKIKGNFASYRLIDLLSIKEVRKVVFNKEIINIAFQFFGHLPVVSNINLYWSFSDKPDQGPQMYHRDLDDYKVLNVFSNLTDTSANNGSYKYIAGSHNKELIKKNINYLDDNFFLNSTAGYGLDSLIKKNDLVKYEKEYFGERGNVMLANGYCLHKAVRPTTNDRLNLWITFNSFLSCYEVRKIPFEKRIDYEIIKNDLVDNLINRYVFRNIINF